MWDQLTGLGIKPNYEPIKIAFTEPAKDRSYKPDFVLPNGIIIETKGRLTTDDRKKHLLVREQHPELDIRFVFQTANNYLRRGSPTTYADWCNKNGFKFAEKFIPQEWIDESD